MALFALKSMVADCLTSQSHRLLRICHFPLVTKLKMYELIIQETTNTINIQQHECIRIFKKLSRQTCPELPTRLGWKGKSK